jgi:SAM-dependent methyltransferase
MTERPPNDEDIEPRTLAKGWDDLAEAYIEQYHDELDHKPRERELLAHFAELARRQRLPVLDLGCGPGHIAHYVHMLGVDVIGVDLSAPMIAIAKRRYLDIAFDTGDMLESEWDPQSLGGALLFYSLVNVPRHDVVAVLKRVHAGLAVGAPLLVAAHAGEGIRRSDRPLGRDVTMAITLYSQDEMKQYVEAAGYGVLLAETRPWSEDDTSSHVYVLATRPE